MSMGPELSCQARLVFGCRQYVNMLYSQFAAMQALKRLSSQSQLEHRVPLVQERVSVPIPDSMSRQPSLHDVKESGYTTALQHSASCDSSNNEAEADLQWQSHLYHQIGVGTFQECLTPSRPNRQARHTPLQSFCRRRITEQLFKACHPPDISSQPILCNSVQLCMTNPLPDPAEYMSAFNYQHWPVASTSSFSPPAKPLARFCSKDDIASDGQQCQAGSEASRHNSVSCRNNALHLGRCNGMFDSSARLQCNEVELLPVTSSLRDPRRRTHPRTAFIPEAGPSSPEVSLLLLLAYLLLSDQ